MGNEGLAIAAGLLRLAWATRVKHVTVPPMPPHPAFAQLDTPAVASTPDVVPMTVVTPVTAPVERPHADPTCLPCTADHLSGVCGGLAEALRFARREGPNSAEAQFRIAKSEDELNTWERYDLAPEKVAALSPHDQELVRWAVNQTKPIRDRMKASFNSIEELEALAAQACRTRLEFRVRHLGLPPAIMDVADKVQRGEVTKAEAHGQIKALVKERNGG